MSDERLALPGFLTPNHPKESMRVFARPDGRVELVLAENRPVGEPVPDYYVLLSTEYGQDIRLHATVRNGAVVVIRDEHGPTQKYLLRMGPPCITFMPATYTVRAMVNSQEVYFKNLTVLAHPDLVRNFVPPQAPVPDEIA